MEREAIDGEGGAGGCRDVEGEGALDPHADPLGARVDLEVQGRAVLLAEKARIAVRLAHPGGAVVLGDPQLSA